MITALQASMADSTSDLNSSASLFPGGVGLVALGVIMLLVRRCVEEHNKARPVLGVGGLTFLAIGVVSIFLALSGS